MLKRLLVALMAPCFFATAIAAATPDRYQVDLLVFSRLSPSNLSSEYWRSSPPWKPRSHLVELAPMPAEPTTNDYPTLTLLPGDQLLLNKAAQDLTQLKHLTILTQMGWQMTREQLNKSTTIALHGGTFISPSVLQEEDASVPNLELSGSISLSMKRYINTTLRLILSEPEQKVTHELLEDRNCSFDGVCRFYFQRKRRTRVKHINYIDTPLLGVLLAITPIKPTSQTH